MTFPTNSPFLPHQLPLVDIAPKPRLPIPAIDTTPVPYSVLEDWYRLIDESINGFPLSTADAEDLRDEIYSYLRG